MADKPTPSTPTTLAPVPGQSTSTADAANASQSASANATASGAASTTNNFTIPASGTGKIYTKGTSTTPATPAATIATSLPTEAGGQGPKGDKGDPGPAGATGPAGPAGVVDYSLVQSMIDAAIAKALNLKIFRFSANDPTQVYGGKTITLPTELYDQIKLTTTVVTPSSYTVGDSTAGTISASGVFTAALVTADKQVTISANYTDTNQTNYTATWVISVKAFKPTSLSVSGPSSLASAGTGTYAATVYYSDGTNKVVTASSGTTWSLSSASMGTLAANVLTGATLATGASNASGTVNASYVENGYTVTGSLPVTVTAPVAALPKPFYGSVAHPQADGFADPSAYGNANWAAFILALPNRATNSTKNNTFPTTCTSTQYGWYAYPKSYGLMTEANIKGAAQPGPGGWDSATDPAGQSASDWGNHGPLTVTGVMINGVPTDFYLYRTDQKNAVDTWTVSG